MTFHASVNQEQKDIANFMKAFVQESVKSTQDVECLFYSVIDIRENENTCEMWQISRWQRENVEVS